MSSTLPPDLGLCGVCIHSVTNWDSPPPLFGNCPWSMEQGKRETWLPFSCWPGLNLEMDLSFCYRAHWDVIDICTLSTPHLGGQSGKIIISLVLEVSPEIFGAWMMIISNFPMMSDISCSHTSFQQCVIERCAILCVSFLLVVFLWLMVVGWFCRGTFVHSPLHLGSTSVVYCVWFRSCVWLRWELFQVHTPLQLCGHL